MGEPEAFDGMYAWRAIYVVFFVSKLPEPGAATRDHHCARHLRHLFLPAGATVPPPLPSSSALLGARAIRQEIPRTIVRGNTATSWCTELDGSCSA